MFKLISLREKSIVFPITFGSMIEWFEVYLFHYWATILSKDLFELSIPFIQLIYAFLILISRALGGVIFGYIGDKRGRRTSFLWSIGIITISNFLMLLTPTTSTMYLPLIVFCSVRFLQGIPAGGELPGALCLLAESAKSAEKRRFLCSFLFVGPQIGQILSMLLCFLLQKYLSHDALMSWGWKLSFFIASIIGIIGYFFRRTLRETDEFEDLKTHEEIEETPLKESFQNRKMSMLICFLISLFEVTGFFTIYFYFFQNSKEILGIDPINNPFIYLFHLIFLTIIMPFIGKIPIKRYSSKGLLKLSAISSIALTIPLYFSINAHSIVSTFILLNALILFLCIQFSILPSFISDLFPTRVRFTCLGFSFNLADGVVGGLIPFLGASLIESTGREASFLLLLPATALIFLLFIGRAKQLATH